jgi:hypothetical protein
VLTLLTLVLALLVASPAPAAAEQPGRPNPELRTALIEASQVLVREGRGLLNAANTFGPEGRRLREEGLRVMEQAAHLAAAAEDLSAQAEQAARSVRAESDALALLAELLSAGQGPLQEAARRLLSESVRLRRAAGRTPSTVLEKPFEGLATGTNAI